MILYLTSLPEILSVLGKDIDVKLNTEELLVEGNVGTYNAALNTITLLEGYPEKDLHDVTIIHELIHATLRRIGAQLDLQTEEILCECISTVLVDNFDILPKGIPQDVLEDAQEEDTDVDT